MIRRPPRSTPLPSPTLFRSRAPSEPMRWLVLWLLFRLMFLSGITKLASGDPTWGDLTALDYHFWTQPLPPWTADRKSTRLNSSHGYISYAVFCLEKKNEQHN